MYPFERFTENAKLVLTLAQAEAERRHQGYIGTEHLLLGLLREEQGLAARALSALGITVVEIQSDLDRVLGKEKLKILEIVPTSRVKRLIEMAFEEARQSESASVGTDHLLLALLKEGQGIAARVLIDRGVTVEKLEGELERLRAITPHETVKGPHGPRGKRRTLSASQPGGGSVRVDLLFPPEYADEQCDRIAERVKRAIEEGNA